LSTEAEVPRRPGRPRSTESHHAILRSTLELLVDGGLKGLSIGAIAQRAGVGKATIYRHWSSKEEIVAEAIESFQAEIDVPDTGSARGDFLEMMGRLVTASEQRGGGADVLSRLLAEASSDPEMHEIFRKHLVEPRRAAVRTILRRAVERGELRDDLDVDLMIDLVVGPNTYRALVEGGDLRYIYGRAPQVFDAVFEGIARRGASKRSRARG
jgi:AcrR family transcriptional regulator